MADQSLNPEPGSVVARLREMRESFSHDSTVDLEVPGYRGELVARYGPLPWDVIRGLAIRGERGKRNPDIGPTLAADGLANAVVGFFVVENGDKQPLTWQGDPVTDFGSALRSVLGIEAATVRETVKAVFSDEFALVSHYGELMEWQSDRDGGEDDALAEAAASDDSVHPTLTSQPEPPSLESD